MAKGSTGTSMQGELINTRKPKPKQPLYDNKKKGEIESCINCMYFYQNVCTYDDTKEPSKTSTDCENYVAPAQQNKNNAGYRKWENKVKRKKAKR